MLTDRLLISNAYQFLLKVLVALHNKISINFSINKFVYVLHPKKFLTFPPTFLAPFTALPPTFLAPLTTFLPAFLIPGIEFVILSYNARQAG